jgi:Protein of unknown function (DUF3489)
MAQTELTTSTVIDEQFGVGRPADNPHLAGTAKASRSKKPTSGRQAKSGRVSSSKKPRQAERGGTKQELVIQMLRQRAGANIDEIIDKTGWQPHSVRGFFSAVVRKKLKLPLVSDVGKDGVRRYHIAPNTSSKD